ncbi:MAG: sulfotransferase family 2 domain-containing protein [Rhodothermales bacterium]
MLVSHLYRFIYTKTSKTASTSVEVFFEPYCMREGEWDFSHGRDEYESEAGIIGERGKDQTGKKWYNHMPASAIKEKLGTEIWDSYFKFCTIRNPFDKLISGFHFDFPQFKENNADKTLMKKAFRERIINGKFLDDRNRYIIGDKMCVDSVIRYEYLQEDMKRICNRLGISYEPARLPRLKAQFRPSGVEYQAYYDLDTIATVANYYKFEILNFQFSIPDLSAARYAESVLNT